MTSDLEQLLDDAANYVVSAHTTFDMNIRYAKRLRAAADVVAAEWSYIHEKLPPEGEPVIGWHPNWICDDFNPRGIRECFRFGDGTEWHNARWNDSQDCYETDKEAPKAWRPYPVAPRSTS
ncbi:hypothetical protein [Kineobactrum salinum]|uniref:DUF551 domain-containing protein n=1 Tax=Kineobactrum salinum TaxID=2708301 RepID=A0A6C0U5N7_9GAMM|nr:hypothetical protein [Kineobactrum salinum]QIB67143.1 hypothetical protein G3T16_18800 [Kineobactrum salinum]